MLQNTYFKIEQYKKVRGITSNKGVQQVYKNNW